VDRHLNESQDSNATQSAHSALHKNKRTRHVHQTKILWVWVSDGDTCSRMLVPVQSRQIWKAQEETNANSSLGSHSKIKSVDILIKVNPILPWPIMQALLCHPGNGKKAHPTFLLDFFFQKRLSATCYLDWDAKDWFYLPMDTDSIAKWWNTKSHCTETKRRKD